MLGLLIALLGTAAASSLPYNTAHPVVDLGYVKYRGSVNSTLNVTSWNGLHYAASPEGSLRWQAPVDIEKANNFSSGQTINATELGPICLQGGPPFSLAFLPSDRGAENCLLLNVHAPSKAVSSKLPVMVYIHGGGYTMGDTQTVPGSFLVSRSRGNIIYVEIQYRLGGLGFLSGDEVRKHGTANVGFLDQRAALQWVQRHIAAFGGDPKKVTVAGGSAGAGSVTAQMQLFGGNDPAPPFRAAMAEFPWWQTYHSDDFVENQYQGLLNSSGCEDITCLRKLPFETLADAIDQTYVNANAAGDYAYGDYYYTPSVDGTVIKELPSAAFASGRISKVPFWTDHDALEGLYFANVSSNSESALRSDLKTFWPASNSSFLSQLDKLYPVSNFSGSYFETPIIAATAPDTTLGQFLNTSFIPGLAETFGKEPYFYKLQEIFGDASISCGTHYTSTLLTEMGVPVWKTVYNTGILVHSAISYPLLTPGSKLYGSEQDVDSLEAYALSFVIDLDPNTAEAFADVKRAYWPKYGHNQTVLDFNFTNIGLASDYDASDRCDFLFNHTSILRI